MNDQDLERQLRSQKSPREEGYTPAPLPATLEAARANRAPARILRAGMFAGAAAAGALAVAVVAVILSGPSHNGVGGGTSPSPSASVSASPGVCAPGDVTLTAEPWGGAAGSRGTVVTVALASGHDPCMLGRGLAAEMTDGNGSVLATTPAQSGGSVALASGASFTIGIAWSNWCAAAPAVPVTLSMKMSGWDRFVAVPVPTGGADPVPPCMGSAEATALSWTGLEPQQ